MNNLHGMNALITGGSQGIGAGICLEMIAAGANISIVDLQHSKSKELADYIVSAGGKAIAIHADLSEEDDCHLAVNETVRALGGIDILVNCAAPTRNKSLIRNLSNEDWGMHQQVVINAALTLAELSADYLAVSGCGSIINISSVTAQSIAYDQCSWSYHASKAALNQLTRYLAVSLGGRGIRCNAIAPGLVNRDQGPKLMDNPVSEKIIKAIVPLQRAGTANDVAKAAVFLSSKNSSYITGQILIIDGGLGINEVYGASLNAFNSAS